MPLYKEDRVLEKRFDGEWIHQGFIDYVFKKGGHVNE